MIFGSKFSEGFDLLNWAELNCGRSWEQFVTVMGIRKCLRWLTVIAMVL